jgi:hypothetical protein
MWDEIAFTGYYPWWNTKSYTMKNILEIHDENKGAIEIEERENYLIYRVPTKNEVLTFRTFHKLDKTKNLDIPAYFVMIQNKERKQNE